MFDEQNKKIEKAVKSANASVGLESKNNDNLALQMIYEALSRAKNNGSFFEELVKLEKEKTAELKEKAGMGYGQR